MKTYFKYSLVLLFSLFIFIGTPKASTDNLYGFQGKYICFKGAQELNSANFETLAYDYSVKEGRDIQYRCTTPGWTYIVFIFNQFGMPLTYNDYDSEIFTFNDVNTYYKGSDEGSDTKICQIGSPTSICPATYRSHYGKKGFSFVLFGNGDTNYRKIEGLHFATDSERSSLSNYQASSQDKNEIINNQNNQFNELKQKQDEQNETSKGIWGTIKEIFSKITNLPGLIWDAIKGGFEAIGNGITALFDGIKGIFLPEPECHTSKNILNLPYTEENKYTFTATRDDHYLTPNTNTVHLESGKVYSFSFESDGIYGNVAGTDTVEVYLYLPLPDRTVYVRMPQRGTFTLKDSGDYRVRIDNNKNGSTHSYWNFQIVEGTDILSYEPYGEICEQGGFFTWFSRLGDIIGGFFSDLLTGILDGLKSLFLPSDDFFSTWISDIQTFFENKLGFLSLPFTLFFEFTDYFLNLNDTGHYVIPIPQLNDVFYGEKIFDSTSLDLAIFLENPTIKTMHDLYLVFVDALILISFVGLCHRKYASIVGVEAPEYEYVSTTEGYEADPNTGEVKKMYHNEKVSRRNRI